MVCDEGFGYLDLELNKNGILLFAIMLTEFGQSVSCLRALQSLKLISVSTDRLRTLMADRPLLQIYETCSGLSFLELFIAIG